MYDVDPGQVTLEKRILRDLGFFGHYLHVNMGGRSGQGHMLVNILARGGHMTQRELQDRSRLTSGALSEVLAKLECAGLITRSKSEKDGRQLDVALTDEGQQRAFEIIAEREAFEGRAFACLDEGEKERLAEMLDRIVEHWHALGGKEGCA